MTAWDWPKGPPLTRGAKGSVCAMCGSGCASCMGPSTGFRSRDQSGRRYVRRYPHPVSTRPRRARSISEWQQRALNGHSSSVPMGATSSSTPLPPDNVTAEITRFPRGTQRATSDAHPPRRSPGKEWAFLTAGWALFGTFTKLRNRTWASCRGRTGIHVAADARVRPAQHRAGANRAWPRAV